MIGSIAGNRSQNQVRAVFHSHSKNKNTRNPVFFLKGRAKAELENALRVVCQFVYRRYFRAIILRKNLQFEGFCPE